MIQGMRLIRLGWVQGELGRQRSTASLREANAQMRGDLRGSAGGGSG